MTYIKHALKHTLLFVAQLSMHVVASKPLYLSSSSVPSEALEEERSVFLAQMAEEEAAKGGKVRSEIREMYRL